ncbi:hypothetical protein EYF80_040968 [Liparis tanakae]|uniref:Uncharacterized protein n=1 Tax=Liparis tanakae TaxID=230148 RepID=A0A4Z2G7R4_9TELE|nr:hypothetical protein EYF80_040968 [Liparis tanakae]
MKWRCRRRENSGGVGPSSVALDNNSSSTREELDEFIPQPERSAEAGANEKPRFLHGRVSFCSSKKSVQLSTPANTFHLGKTPTST